MHALISVYNTYDKNTFAVHTMYNYSIYINIINIYLSYILDGFLFSSDIGGLR